MSSEAVDRFFDLIKGGKSPVEAQEEACMTDEELDRLVLVFSEFCDSERFTTSHYDAAIARRLRKLENGLLKRDETLMHGFSNLNKCVLELVKSVNRLVDAQKAPTVAEAIISKVVEFPCPNPPKAS